MKKFLKRIAVIVSYTLILTTANCFAYTLETDNITTENGEKYNVKTYSVSASEENTFIQNLKDNYTIDGVVYTLKDIKKEGGNTTDKKEIVTTKQITTKTNNREQILNELPATLEYNENGYLGQYKINSDSLEIVSHYNGYTEYLIEENKQYSDLARNDLDFIPKQITKNGMKLDLLKTDWQIQTTKKLGDTDVADKYIANCYYAGKVKKDNPYTYTVTATYSGIAERIVEKPYTYTVSYKIEEIRKEPQKEESKINVLPVLGGSSIVIIAVFFIIRKNTKVYNLRYGHWKLVGKTFVSKPKIDLTRFSDSEVTNRYKIELSKNTVNKLGKSTIQIVKGSNIVEHKIKIQNEPYTFEITI